MAVLYDYSRCLHCKENIFRRAATGDSTAGEWRHQGSRSWRCLTHATPDAAPLTQGIELDF